MAATSLVTTRSAPYGSHGSAAAIRKGAAVCCKFVGCYGSPFFSILTVLAPIPITRKQVLGIKCVCLSLFRTSNLTKTIFVYLGGFLPKTKTKTNGDKLDYYCSVECLFLKFQCDTLTKKREVMLVGPGTVFADVLATVIT